MWGGEGVGPCEDRERFYDTLMFHICEIHNLRSLNQDYYVISHQRDFFPGNMFPTIGGERHNQGLHLHDGLVQVWFSKR